jgi:hypothetical protein
MNLVWTDLVTGAGFREVHIRIMINPFRQPSMEEYVQRYLSASPMASDVAAMDDTRRTALLQDMQRMLGTYVDNDGLVVPIESHVVVAST